MTNKEKAKLWESVREATGYQSEDIRGFCNDEGLKTPLNDFNTLKLYRIVLCNFAVREGYTETWSQAAKQYDKMCKELSHLDVVYPSLWLRWLEIRDLTLH